ncbi:MAG: pyridoxal phosphate-dependent aminotransferase [Oscillospiraceae bacterium]|jgi:cystathionine beta-lyase|nr:pyridoxal phosphate-dependent aminotransferase [Oscillospiraceae bacterium]
MKYDFDSVIDRRDTDSLKYDHAARRGMPEGLTPMWVADMDFRSPPCVLDALAERVRHGIFGYSEPPGDYFEAARGWFERRHGWRIEENWLVKTPGVVMSLCTAIHAVTRPGDAVIIQQPVYYPFAGSVTGAGRRLVVNELRLTDGRYEIDFDDFEEKVVRERVKLFLLCSPHNPGGRVWTRPELERLGAVCLKNGVTVFSDEIHEDFVFPGRAHTVFANISPELDDITITGTSPSKTFNIAGLHIANTFISNRRLRRKFIGAYNGAGMSQVGAPGIVACRAAYSGGDEWADELVAYIRGNLDCLRGFIGAEAPRVEVIEPDGTYLVWLDFRRFGLSDAELDDIIVNRAGLWLDSGAIFGAGGKGFQRINIACPRSVLTRALDRLADAFRGVDAGNG